MHRNWYREVHQSLVRTGARLAWAKAAGSPSPWVGFAGFTPPRTRMRVRRKPKRNLKLREKWPVLVNPFRDGCTDLHSSTVRCGQ